MKKILVTGGAGFIGSHTVVELYLAGYQPIIVDNFSNSERWIVDRIGDILGEKPVMYDGDCSDVDFLSEVFKEEGKISGVIHFAGYKSVGESVDNPVKYYKNNLNSLMTVLEVMKDADTHNLVFSSSATVYGDADSSPVPETAQQKEATSPYGNTKSICEDILSDVSKVDDGITSISLRYFNPVGAHPSGLIGELPIGVPNNIAPYIAQTAAGIRETLTIFGDDYHTPDGTCVRDFVHVVDLAKAHIVSLKHLESNSVPKYDVYNVGTGKGTSVLELVAMFEKENAVTVPYKIGARREGDVAVYYADVDKIKTNLGWTTEKSVKDAVRDMWKWQQSLTE